MKYITIYIIIYTLAQIYHGKEKNAMSEIVKTMKLHIHVNETEAKSLEELTACYAQACTFISKYVFDHGFILNFMKLQETLYQTIRAEFGQSPPAIKRYRNSCFRTRIAMKMKKGKTISSVGHWNGFKSRLCFVALRLIL